MSDDWDPSWGKNMSSGPPDYSMPPEVPRYTECPKCRATAVFRDSDGHGRCKVCKEVFCADVEIIRIVGRLPRVPDS